jgi:hypothetical protein
MGWKYECGTYFHEGDRWTTGYMGDSLLGALRYLRWARRNNPGRAYRLVIR